MLRSFQVVGTSSGVGREVGGGSRSFMGPEFSWHDSGPSVPCSHRSKIEKAKEAKLVMTFNP